MHLPSVDVYTAFRGKGLSARGSEEDISGEHESVFLYVILRQCLG